MVGILHLTLSLCHTLSEMPDLELDEDLKKTVCLRAGGTLRLFVTVNGRPTPVVAWRKKGVELQSRGYIETTDSYTMLIVENVNRYDAGKYVLEAENPSGKKTITILVKVYGRSKVSTDNKYAKLSHCFICAVLCPDTTVLQSWFHFRQNM